MKCTYKILCIFIILNYNISNCLILNEEKSDGFESSLRHIKPKTNEITQKNAVLDLIKRLIPERVSEFKITINKDAGPVGKDTFKIYTLGNEIHITGTSGVAAAAAFNFYLKSCKLQVTWQTKQLNLPKVWPHINITYSSNDRFRYYQNVCTTSYSFVWWTWKEWEKHIDWMALNSFNLVLAFTGQERIWYNIYKKLNMTTDEVNDHFGGSAFLSWSRMGNIRGWGGPLTENWHEKTYKLQLKILERMRNLGITPVLPAFSGHVPTAFKRLFPNAKMTRISTWNNFEKKYCCPYLLDPTDLLFKKVGKMFMEEQINNYGTDHIYNCDTFNEMAPSSGDVKYLSQISKSIFSAMTDVDPKSIWLLQGWLFYNDESFWNKDRVKSFITSVPMGRMIVLDLQSEQFPQYSRLESYFGQPFIWCMLHNFGGTLGMFGSAQKINMGVFEGRSFPNSTMVGIGLTPEGINQNYVIYDLMIEMGWRKKITNLSIWFEDYAIRRYGQYDKNAINAWQILKDTVYNYNSVQKMRGKYVITRSPRLNIKPWFWYNATEFMGAWDNLLNVSSELYSNEGYRYDMVDVTRQALQILGDLYYPDLIKSFRRKYVDDFLTMKQVIEQIFLDLDLILSTNEHFLLGNWLESAKAVGITSSEKQLYEFNARNQITLWGPRGEIKDYANKQWAGVVSHYFHPRWNLFMSVMTESLVNSQPFDEQSIVARVFNEIELPFTNDRTLFPTQVKGDTIQVAKDIFQRWRDRIYKMPTTKRRNRYRI